jgi:hypothetical protein
MVGDPAGIPMTDLAVRDDQSDSAAVPPAPSVGPLSAETATFYRRMMRGLIERGLPFLVGGAYAFARYTGIERHTKDFDIFVRPEDAERALELLGKIGCSTEMTFPHWLGKAWCGEDFIDVIFSSGNGIADVDDDWFSHAVEETVLGVPVRLIPPEEMLWSKAFVMERERFDGADINHLLLHMADRLDWDRLLQRFGTNAAVLFAHVTLFRFAYPGFAHGVPASVIDELFDRSNRQASAVARGSKMCRGTILSRQQYLVDVHEWGYLDGRQSSDGSMSAEEIAAWTNAIETIP